MKTCVDDEKKIPIPFMIVSVKAMETTLSLLESGQADKARECVSEILKKSPRSKTDEFGDGDG